MKELLSDELWVTLSARFQRARRLRAAIAYVTTSHFGFRKGDTLICDGSDQSIMNGATAVACLRELLERGVDVYSYAGLHAKVAVIDDCALIGSANMSASAGVRTCEASLLTDDAQVVGLIVGFIERIRSDSERIDRAFLDRASQLPIAARPEPPILQGQRRVLSTRSRVWLVSTRELSDRLQAEEEDADAAGHVEAEEHRSDTSYEVRSLRWTGRSRFRSEAKAGDLVVEVAVPDERNPMSAEVYCPAPIVHRTEDVDGKWTRFYLEIPAERTYYKWPDVEADLAALGVTHLSAKSTRELTGRAMGLLPLLIQQ
jgi:hypothetical protein